MTYDKLLKEACNDNLEVFEQELKPRIKGLYADNVILINRHLPTRDKHCVLAEELGHYHTSQGNILDQSKLQNRKQELRARRWAYEKLVPLEKIVQAHKTGITSKHELAEFLDITEVFLSAALKRYQEKYGMAVKVNDKYTVCFEPLGVLEMFEE